MKPNPVINTIFLTNSARLAAVFTGLALAGASAQTTLFSDDFAGDPAAVLNGTTPDVTTAGATWVAMNGGDLLGQLYADGNIQVTGGNSGTRGGSATLAFTPQNGFIYTLDLSATGLNSAASHSTANRLYFGFASGQSSGNGSANRLEAGSSTVTGKVTEGYMTKVGYNGNNGIANRAFNSTSEDEWLALTTAYGNSIDMRVVLDTSDPGNWTATWYAKKPADVGYFSLIREAGTEPGGYSSWAALNGASPNLDDDHDGDGVSNGVEYFIGGPNGNTTGFTALPGVDNTSGTLSVTWTHAADYTGTYGTDFEVETSATLANPWTTESEGVNVTITGNDVKYTFPAGTKNFARLVVTGPL